MGKTNSNELKALMERYKQLLVSHAALEAKVMVLDSVVGTWLNTGQKPIPMQIAQFWQQAAKTVAEKYPGVQLVTKPVEAKPMLYIPTNGAKMGLN